MGGEGWKWGGWGCRITILRFQIAEGAQPWVQVTVLPGVSPEAWGCRGSGLARSCVPARGLRVQGPQGGSVREGGALPAHQGLAAAAQGRGRAMRKCQDGWWEAQLRESAVGPAARPVLRGAATRAHR